MPENDPIALPADESHRPQFLGFAPPLLGAEPVRLPLLACANGLLALNLPGGIAADAHPLNPADAPQVVRALKAQLASGKAELHRLGIKTAQSVFHLEPELSGVALFAVNKDSVETWRNAFGSRQLEFRFLLVCERNAALPDELLCELPIAPHKAGGQMLVSHKTGKKTETRFRRLAVARQEGKRDNPAFDRELWEARTTFLRPHQIRLHAHEVGLRICGEALYADVPPLVLSELKGLRRPLKDEQPLWPRPALHLEAIGFTGAADADPAAAPSALPVSAPLPRQLALGVWLLFGDISGIVANEVAGE